MFLCKEETNTHTFSFEEGLAQVAFGGRLQLHFTRISEPTEFECLVWPLIERNPRYEHEDIDETETKSE